MENVQRETLSNREFYFVLYVSMLVVVGWLFDTNGLFLSKWFSLAGVILVPIIGSVIAFAAMSLTKRTQR